jgi:Holliday junction DNA helicase RuvA
MYNYIIGKVTEQSANKIVLENSNIGYEIIVARPFEFELNKTIKVYIYQHIREDSNKMFGFKTVFDKDVYLKLLSVNGVGPKSALNFFVFKESQQLIEAIEQGDEKFLTSIPGIGKKTANQVILDIRGKFKIAPSENNHNREIHDEVVAALEAMGYKKIQIEKKIAKVDDKDKTDLEQYIKSALKKMME